MRTLLFSLIIALSRLTVAAAPETVVYKKVEDRELKIFIERPAAWKATDQRPAIVFYFGDRKSVV